MTESLQLEDIKKIVEDAVSVKFDAVLGAAKNVAEKMADDFMKREAEKAKTKAESSYNRVELQSKGNKNQFEHTREVLGDVEEAIECIDKNELAKAKEFLEKGKKSLKERIKLIRIADRDGWGTVLEYMSDDLADNSSDEKAIDKARRISYSKRRKRDSNKGRYFKNRAYSNISSSNNFVQQNLNSNPVSRNQPSGNFQHQPRGVCWNCGNPGHYIRSCNLPRNMNIPNLASAQNNGNNTTNG